MSLIGDLREFPPLGSAKSGKTVLKAPFDASKDESNNGDGYQLDFRKLFSTSSMNKSLEFYAPELTDDEVIVTPSEDVLCEGRDLWSTAVVAQFIGKVPNLSYFQRMVKLIWGADGDVDIFPAGDNLFILQFPSAVVRDRVLESGPWHVNNQPLIIRKWEPGLKSLDFSLSKVPVWLHLRNVPLELFTRRGLSYIASGIGNPLYMDSITAERKKLAYAKVCVEIDVARKIPQYITVVLGSNCKTTVLVDTLWLPAKCVQCCVFGHSEKTCPNRKFVDNVQVWKPKQQGIKTDVVGSGNTPNLEVGSGSRGSNSHGSVERFSIPLEGNDKDASSSNMQQPTTVAALMDSIKAQVKDTMKRLEVDKGKGVLAADVKDDVSKDFVVKDVEIRDVECSVQRQITNGNKEVNLEDKKLDEDSASESDLVQSRARPKLPIANLVRPQRLAALGVVKAVELVKSQNKKSRRQAKKFSVSKK